MKTITIQSLRLQNFKGITDFSIDPAGKNISLYGKNATGKTTIQDAVSWLFSGKDSTGSADFCIKPVTETGDEIHNIETEVEAVLDVSGKTVRLLKRFYEKLTKKRGESKPSFTGHTKDHFVDEVPVKEKDFNSRVSEIIGDLNKFKLVTNPFEFPGLHWTKRRNFIVEMCGDVSTQDVIDSDSKLSSLSEILSDCTIDDHRAKIKAKQEKINDELKNIPVRISEQQKNIDGAEKPDPIEKRCVNAALEEAHEKLQALKSNEALSQKRVRLNEIKSEITMARSAAEKKASEKRWPIQDKIDKLKSDRRENVNKISEINDQIAQDERRNSISIESKDKLLERWHAVNNEKPGENNSCPTCGQNLPEDQIEDAIKAFNRSKSERLESVEKEGMTLKIAIESRGKSIASAKESIDTISKVIDGIDKEIEIKSAELEKISTPVSDTTDLEKEKAAIESEIAAMENGSKIQEKNARDKIEQEQSKLDAWNKINAEWEAAEKSRARIEELERQEKTLAAEYEKLAEELHIVELFTIKQAELLDEKVNSHFKIARFKLFKEQINGGIEPCCEIMCNGVPFDRGLNNAARINTGLDIINTLSEHFGFSAPVFIDNRESVNELIPINSQVISLVVSDDEKLTIKSNKEVKAA